MKKNLHPIMLAGTGSDVGKSVIAAALCRIFKQDGYRPAPLPFDRRAVQRGRWKLWFPLWKQKIRTA